MDIQRDREDRESRNLTSTSFLPKLLQSLKPLPDFPQRCRGPGTWTILHYFPRYINKEMDQKSNNQD